MSSVWDAVYNPEPSELETKVTSYEARIALLEAENQRLRVALDRYCGQIDRFGTESAGEALQEQEE